MAVSPRVVPKWEGRSRNTVVDPAAVFFVGRKTLFTVAVGIQIGY